MFPRSWVFLLCMHTENKYDVTTEYLGRDFFGLAACLCGRSLVGSVSRMEPSLPPTQSSLPEGAAALDYGPITSCARNRKNHLSVLTRHAVSDSLSRRGGCGGAVSIPAKEHS